MRGLLVPDREDDFTADPVELFFDLSYVFAFSQLVVLVVREPTWEGVGRAALLFALVWIPWAQFQWSANAVSGNAPAVRVWFLVATTAAIPMGASVATAFEGGGPVFAVSQAVILGMGLLTMIVGLDDDAPEAVSIRAYAGPNWVAMAVMVVGAFLPGAARLVAWMAALLIILIMGMLRAGSRTWIVRTGHFAERHGLIVIVALGELVVATGIGVSDALAAPGGQGAATTPTAATLATLVACGAFAGLLWWCYFDRPQPALEHAAEGHQGAARGRFARDVWSLWHLPIVLGVILAAAALEEVALHPTDRLPLAFRTILGAGLVLYLGGISGAVWRAVRVVALERLVAVLVVVAVVLLGSTLSGLVLLGVVDLAVVGLLAVEASRTGSAGHVEPVAVA